MCRRRFYVKLSVNFNSLLNEQTFFSFFFLSLVHNKKFKSLKASAFIVLSTLKFPLSLRIKNHIWHSSTLYLWLASLWKFFIANLLPSIFLDLIYASRCTISWWFFTILISLSFIPLSALIMNEFSAFPFEGFFSLRYL